VAEDGAGRSNPRVRGRARSAEERKVVTGLFADLVGSTLLASGQDPEHLRALPSAFIEWEILSLLSPRLHALNALGQHWKAHALEPGPFHRALPQPRPVWLEPGPALV